MNFKSSVIAAALLAATAGAYAGTPITLIDNGGNVWSGTFEGSGASNTFDLDLTSFAAVSFLESAVSANVSFGSGYNVTNVTFDGVIVYAADVNTAKKDLWTLSLGGVTPTLHTIEVFGESKLGGKFTGSVGVEVTPVPEPETYALMLAGLGAVGFVARRRKAV